MWPCGDHDPALSTGGPKPQGSVSVSGRATYRSIAGCGVMASIRDQIHLGLPFPEFSHVPFRLASSRCARAATLFVGLCLIARPSHRPPPEQANARPVRCRLPGTAPAVSELADKIAAIDRRHHEGPRPHRRHRQCPGRRYRNPPQGLRQLDDRRAGNARHAFPQRRGGDRLPVDGAAAPREEEGCSASTTRSSKWFPDYPKADKVTLHMLMIDLRLCRLCQPRHPAALRGSVPAIHAGRADRDRLSQPMVCDPGTCFAYAHTNFVILGEVLRKAAGKPIEATDQRLRPRSARRSRIRSSEATPVIQQPVLHAFTGERGMVEDSTYWNPSWTLATRRDDDDRHRRSGRFGDRDRQRQPALRGFSRAAGGAAETAGIKPFSDTVYYGMGLMVNNGWAVQNPIVRRIFRCHGQPAGA